MPPTPGVHAKTLPASGSSAISASVSVSVALVMYRVRFQSYLALAFGVWLGLQASVNIGVNMGVLPTKGLTLPLLSYGRSSLFVSLAWLGVVLRIYHEVKCSSRSAVTRMPGGAR
jgi:cell division protein FtsW (lipid II flippase)